MLHLVDEAVLAINPPGPATFQFMLQRLGFSGAAERLPLNIADQANDPQGLRAILFPTTRGPRTRRRQTPSFSMTSSSERPCSRSFAASRGLFSFSFLRGCFVPRAAGMAPQKEIDTLPA